MLEQHSPEIGKLAEALSKAQGQIEGAKEDSSNPFFKSKYADLRSVWNACKKPLTDNGLAVIQTVDSKEDKMLLVTTLAHSSGQWMKSFLPIPITKNDPQTLGSAITYARRYALAAIAGVCPIDDDAEEAMRPVREKQIIEQNTKKISDKQCAFLDTLLKDDPDATPLILKRCNLSSVYDMSMDDFNNIIDWLKNRKRDGKNGQARVA